jgi:Rieske Fe-S protein
LSELQKDPITRGDFLAFGILGAISGAILTIPPAAFVLGPVIKTELLGQSDVKEGWVEVGPISEIPDEEPTVFEVLFPIEQAYGNNAAQGTFPEAEKAKENFTIKNAIWLSWKREVTVEGTQGSGGDTLGKSMKPSFVEEKSEGFTQEEIQELEGSINVLSNSCAHLGCPVRWLVSEDTGHGEFLCPCHGGIYDINGGYVGGPPPRGMYRYTQIQVREDGKLYAKHEYDIGVGQGPQRPYVV